MTSKLIQLQADLPKPGLAVDLVARLLARRRWGSAVDISAIADETGESPRKIAWGIAVLRARGQLPVGIKVAPMRPDPCRNLAAAPVAQAAEACSGLSCPLPTAPPAPASNPEVSHRVEPERRQAPDSAVDRASVWLIATLANRPLRAREVRARAEAAGHAWRTLQRARILVGVEAKVRGCDGGVWVLRAERRPEQLGAVPAPDRR